MNADWPSSSNVVPFPGSTRGLATVTPIRPDVDPPTAADRARALLALAQRIAELTDPSRPLQQSDLTGTDRVLIAIEIPNLPDGDARQKFLGIVAELHQVELAGRIDERDPEYVHPDEYTESAAQLARDAVSADIAAAGAA